MTQYLADSSADCLAVEVGGMKLRYPDGSAAGHVVDLRAERESSQLVVSGLIASGQGFLHRLGLVGGPPAAIPWSQVQRVDREVWLSRPLQGAKAGHH